MHSIKKVLFGLIIFTMVGTNLNLVFASDSIVANHILTNEALIQGQETPISIMFHETEITSNDFLSAVNHKDVPPYWLIPASAEGYIYYSYVVEYKDGRKIRGFEEHIDIEALGDFDDIVSLNLYYSHASKITVNRYLNEVSSESLLETVDYYGHQGANYITYGGDPVIIEGLSLSVDQAYGNYEFVSSSEDISQAIDYERKNPKTIDLVYKEKEALTPKDVIIKCIDKAGNLLQETVISGELGDVVNVDDSFFENRNSYKLTEKPEVTETQVSEEEQEFIFVYDKYTNKKPPITPDKKPGKVVDDSVVSKVEPEVKKPVVKVEEQTNIDSKQTPKTGIDQSMALYVSVIGLAIATVLIIKKREA